jgi:hypothetical protein
MIGGENLTSAQWYFGLAHTLWRSFSLGKKVNFKTWWKQQENLSSVQKLSQFMEDILLQHLEGKIFIFVDEIDTVKSLDFATDDFFAFIRFCYNQRAENPEYYRLNWALFGVTTPADLISNNFRTPFNIGKAIELTGFQGAESFPLIKGLEGKVENAQATLREILNWTNGQPFLTQKLCKLMVENAEFSSPGKNNDYSHHLSSKSPFLAQLITDVLTNHSDLKIQVATVVKSRIINNWQFHDHPQHLKTISERLLRSNNREEVLKLYKQILISGKITHTDSPAINELLLSGIVIKKQDQIRVSNPIYATIFNLDWVNSQIAYSPTDEYDTLCEMCLDIMDKMNPDNWSVMGKAIAQKYPDQAKILLKALTRKV